MAAMVGEALLSTFIQSLFDSINSVEIMDFFQRKKELKLLEKLKTTLLSVIVVLNDAETKQLRNPSVKLWLEGLKDVVEDAENLLDEISTEALEAKILSAESGTSSKRRKLSSLVSPITNFLFGKDKKAELEEILERLDYYASQKDILGLTIVVGERLSRRLPSTSLVEDSELYGRQCDKNAVKKLVLCDAAEAVSVIPIVGMGGVGKTTLAQDLFNDDEVKKYFEVKAWVCVSEDFDVCKTTKNLLESVTDSACETMELNMLQVRLKEKLNQKKFLVVLDDVWNENYDDWNVLRRPFQDGAKGSKMIVTTRSKKAASVMGSSRTHHLRELSNDDCWKLFAKHASGNGDFMKYAKLENIGREIVMKCKGLPLAAKTLGGLLRSTFDVGEWERVLRSDIWDFTDEESNILPALRVSYHYLPSHLKRCFAHCSMFPKDYEFRKEELVLLWMAENLIGHSKGNKTMEDVGDEYFNDLVSRSLIQKIRDKDKSRFVMHDLTVDLAKLVSSNSFQFEGVESSSESVTKLRHLTYYARTRDSYKRFSHVLEATRLRTFLPLCRYGENNISDRVVGDLLLKLKCLRSLSFHGYKNIKKLPDTIGELKYLRYLDLSGTSIGELPESVCRLYNLQTLDLSGCYRLKSLPRYIHRLINLRRLRISEQCIEMPTQMSKLKNLQTLNIFIVGKDDETRLCELRDLSNLRGSLCIKKMNIVVDAKDAAEAKLIDKKHLRELFLDWECDDTNDTTHDKLVLKNIAPSRSLKILEINHYGGTSFPNWVGDHTYDNIVRLKLLNCKYCTSLPPLGQLVSLKTLEICGFPAVEVVDHNFFGNSTSSSTKGFQSLEELVFSDKSNWNEWQMEDDVAFPKLKKLRIHSCPNFTGNLPQLLPSLTTLSIENCRLIDCLLPTTMPAVHTLELVDCGNLLTQELPPSVQSLSIRRCGNNFVSLSETLMKMETCLQHLKIDDCPSLTKLRNLSASLKHLEIRNCVKLEFPYASSHESLNRLSIENSCDCIQCFPLNSFTNLTTLKIMQLKNLESLSMFDGDMASLSGLTIHSCPKFVSFPAGGFSAPKLTFLWILKCKKLKCWPEQMHTLFPSLERLWIYGCPEVESFPGASLPSTLREITVGNCDKLVASRTSWHLTRLTKLEVFIIQNSSEIRCFPEEALLPTSITSLTIWRLSSLETLDQNALQQLTSLKRLNIWLCPKLRAIPVGGLPNSLELLEIYQCPLLLEQSDELKKQISECPNDIFLNIT